MPLEVVTIELEGTLERLRRDDPTVAVERGRAVMDCACFSAAEFTLLHPPQDVKAEFYCILESIYVFPQEVPK